MNKHTLIIMLTVLALVAAVPVFADGREAGSMQIGGLLSLGASNVDATVWSGPSVGGVLAADPSLWGDGSIDPGGAGGIGFSFRYFLTDALALNTGLGFVAKSFTLVYPARTAATDLELECTAYFITVPLGLRYVADIFYFGGGLYYGMASDMDVEISANGNAVTETLPVDDDFGLYIELGLDIGLGERLSLDLGARYERGLVAIYDEDDVITDIKTRALLFSIGLSYLL